MRSCGMDARRAPEEILRPHRRRSRGPNVRPDADSLSPTRRASRRRPWLPCLHPGNCAQHCDPRRRHVRLTLQAIGPEPSQTPPFLILFINSICNLTCEHCFYWQNLNKRDDLTLDEIRRALEGSRTGREPEPVGRRAVPPQGIRRHVPPVRRTERHAADLRADQRLLHRADGGGRQAVLERPELWFFVCELSLDGTAEYHDRFRGNKESFQKAMETYDALAELQAADPRLRIHAISTATAENLGRDPAPHGVSVSSAAPDGPSQPRAHPRGSQEPVAAGAGSRRVPASWPRTCATSGRRASAAGSAAAWTPCCTGPRWKPRASGGRSCHAGPDCSPGSSMPTATSVCAKTIRRSGTSASTASVSCGFRAARASCGVDRPPRMSLHQRSVPVAEHHVSAAPAPQAMVRSAGTRQSSSRPAMQRSTDASAARAPCAVASNCASRRARLGGGGAHGGLPAIPHVVRRRGVQQAVRLPRFRLPRPRPWPEGFGTIELALAITLFFVNAVDGGLGSHGARVINTRPEEARRVLARRGGQSRGGVLAYAPSGGLAVVWAPGGRPAGRLRPDRIHGTPVQPMDLPGVSRDALGGRGRRLRNMTFAILVFALARPGSTCDRWLAEVAGAAALGVFTSVVLRRVLQLTPDWTGPRGRGAHAARGLAAWRRRGQLGRPLVFAGSCSARSPSGAGCLARRAAPHRPRAAHVRLAVLLQPAAGLSRALGIRDRMALAHRGRSDRPVAGVRRRVGMHARRAVVVQPCTAPPTARRPSPCRSSSG